MRLQVCGIDHDPLRFPALRRQRHEDAVEYAKQAPAYKAIVKRLVRTIGFRGVFPLKAMFDHVDDSADHPTVVNPRYAMRQWKKRRDPRHLALAQQEKNQTWREYLRHAQNHTSASRGKRLMGPEPSITVVI